MGGGIGREAVLAGAILGGTTVIDMRPVYWIKCNITKYVWPTNRHETIRPVYWIKCNITKYVWPYFLNNNKIVITRMRQCD